MTDALEKLVNYLREDVGFEGQIDPDIDLLEEKILDSFSVVEIASYIQSNFAVELDGDDLTKENFSSLSNMVTLIEKRSI